jgi:hypothetical protein
VEFGVDKVALGQVFSEYFGFPCQFSFHRLLHTHHHLSSGAGTMGQILTDVPSGLSLTPPQKKTPCPSHVRHDLHNSGTSGFHIGCTRPIWGEVAESGGRDRYSSHTVGSTREKFVSWLRGLENSLNAHGVYFSDMRPFCR